MNVKLNNATISHFPVAPILHCIRHISLSSVVSSTMLRLILLQRIFKPCLIPRQPSLGVLFLVWVKLKLHVLKKITSGNRTHAAFGHEPAVLSANHYAATAVWNVLNFCLKNVFSSVFSPENVDAYMAASGSDNVEEKLKVNVLIFYSLPVFVIYTLRRHLGLNSHQIETTAHLFQWELVFPTWHIR